MNNILTESEKEIFKTDDLTYEFGGQFSDKTVTRKLSTCKFLAVNIEGNHIQILGWKPAGQIEMQWIEGSK